MTGKPSIGTYRSTAVFASLHLPRFDIDGYCIEILLIRPRLYDLTIESLHQQKRSQIEELHPTDESPITGKRTVKMAVILCGIMIRRRLNDSFDGRHLTEMNETEENPDIVDLDNSVDSPRYMIQRCIAANNSVRRIVRESRLRKQRYCLK